MTSLHRHHGDAVNPQHRLATVTTQRHRLPHHHPLESSSEKFSTTTGTASLAEHRNNSTVIIEATPPRRVSSATGFVRSNFPSTNAEGSNSTGGGGGASLGGAAPRRTEPRPSQASIAATVVVSPPTHPQRSVQAFTDTLVPTSGALVLPSSSDSSQSALDASGATSDFVANEAYLRQQEVPQLVAQLYHNCLVEQPAEPIQYIIEQLRRPDIGVAEEIKEVMEAPVHTPLHMSAIPPFPLVTLVSSTAKPTASTPCALSHPSSSSLQSIKAPPDAVLLPQLATVSEIESKSLPGGATPLASPPPLAHQPFRNAESSAVPVLSVSLSSASLTQLVRETQTYPCSSSSGKIAAGPSEKSAVDQVEMGSQVTTVEPVPACTESSEVIPLARSETLRGGSGNPHSVAVEEKKAIEEVANVESNSSTPPPSDTVKQQSIHLPPPHPRSVLEASAEGGRLSSITSVSSSFRLISGQSTSMPRVVGGSPQGLQKSSMRRSTSFNGSSLSDTGRGELRSSSDLSAFSCGSVDVQEFLADFREAKFQRFAGKDLLTLDDLSEVLDLVNVPLPDATLLSELFDELKTPSGVLVMGKGSGVTSVTVPPTTTHMKKSRTNSASLRQADGSMVMSMTGSSSDGGQREPSVSCPDEEEFIEFDVFLSRMAFMVQGRYPTEVIRSAFFAMMEEYRAGVLRASYKGRDWSDCTLYSSVEPINPPQNSKRAFNSNQEEPSRSTVPGPSGLQASVQPNFTQLSQSLPLHCCVMDGLYRRLGMRSLTTLQVQAALRAACLPEDDLNWGCHVNDFITLAQTLSQQSASSSPPYSPHSVPSATFPTSSFGRPSTQSRAATAIFP